MSSLDRIAIVGLAGLFSDAPTLEQFWDVVHHGRDTSREVPGGRWPLPPESVFDARPGTADRLYSLRGYFIDDCTCDGNGLDVDPALLARLDPLFHLTLRTAHAAWRSAATDSVDKKRVGAIFGNIVLPTETAAALAEAILVPTLRERLGLDAAPALAAIEPRNCRAAGLPARLVAAALGLGGRAFTLDAACASSLFAIKLAAEELLSGRADAMLTGGVCRPDCFYTQMGFSQLRALSSSGVCRPFDSRADGLLVGEGAGFFVLKRLGDALAHGDTIHGVIAGIGLSNDTRGNLLAPDGAGQRRALRQAYRAAGWQPDAVDLIECHATGTPVGDRVELESMRALWGESSAPERRCMLGSVKANVGHTLTAAGSAGLLKVLLALRHGTLPPAGNCASPRPELSGAESPFRILHEPEEWRPRRIGQPRRAAVNAFGFGGTNAHLLVEEWLPLGQSGKVTVPAGPVDQLAAAVGLAAHVPAATEESAATDRWWGVDQSNWFRELGAAGLLERHRLVDAVRLSPAAYSIPPRDLEEMLPQQLLMLQVAAHALADAGWSKEHADRTGVFIGLRLDLNTSNFHVRWSLAKHARHWAGEMGWHTDPVQLDAWVGDLRDSVGPPLTPGRTLGALASTTASRIARAFGIGGPSFTISSEETSGVSALRAALALLQSGDIDHAVVGAVDLPGDIRELIAAYLVGTPGDDARQSHDPMSIGVTEGAAAIVLRRVNSNNDLVRSRSWPVDHGVLERLASGGPILGLLPVVEAAHATPGAAATEVSDAGVQTAGSLLTIHLGHPALHVPMPPAANQEFRHDNIDHPVFDTDIPLPLQPFFAAQTARAEAHAGYLRFSQTALATLASIAELPVDLKTADGVAGHIPSTQVGSTRIPSPLVGEGERGPPPRAKKNVNPNAPLASTAVVLDRAQCLEFATGKIANVLGPEYAAADAFPTRVRLPAEPMMFVDRVLSLAGEPHRLESGAIVTEHDTQAGAWYDDNGQVAACVAIESGQADLLLSAYLGIDARTRGLALYRLLDATVTFHRGLPAIGSTLRYDIHLDRFFRQGQTYLFHFRFEATVAGEPLLSMTGGCAGFFTPVDLAAGQGIRVRPIVPTGIAPTAPQTREIPGGFAPGRYGEGQLAALRRGDLAGCFGIDFSRLGLGQPLTLPDGYLALIDRVTVLDPCGGSYGLGLIRAEQDIDPQAWFLTCHFIDDQVMPGTLMYECCLQTLRILLLRLGWVADRDSGHFEPVPGVATRLRCRGQVTAGVRAAAYEITLKRLGREPEPFAIADALLYADGKPIVEITDLSLRLTSR